MLTTATVTRWRRYGYDRLYVRNAAGEPLGWSDPTTGQLHEVPPEHEATVTAAVDAWLTAHRLDVRPAPRPECAPPAVRTLDVADHRPAPSTADPVDDTAAAAGQGPPAHDLAENPAGAAVRDLARARRQEAPVRTLLARFLGIHTEERAARVGLAGETKVGAELAKLTKADPHWRVLHAIPVGTNGADIDHLVLGHGRALCLNTKHHPDGALWVGGDTFLVNGNRVPYVRNSRHEAARASRLLTSACGFPVPVTGVLVVVGAESLTVKTAPRDVHVVARRQLRSFLTQLPPAHLGDAQLDATYAAARIPATWVS